MGQLACEVLLGPSSPLYRRLYEQGLVNATLDCYYDAAPGCAHLMVSGESRDPEQVLEQLLQEAGRLARDGVDEGLWERLKRAAYGGMVRRLNSLESTCIDLAQAYFEGEDYLRFPQRFQSVEREHVRQLIARWCTRERAALSLILPAGGAAQSRERR